jgi:tetratricopeptide (TPR) repeat protein
VELDPRNPYTLQQLASSYQQLRRYPEMATVLDRALTIVPNDVATKTFRALSDVADNWFECGLSKRDWAAAEQALAALGDNPCWSDQVLQFNRQFGEGLLARAMHDDARAHRAFTAARVEQEQLVQKRKNYGPPLCVLGLIDAALGNREAALQEGRRAMELLPREKDATNGETLFGYFAVIAAWAGEKDFGFTAVERGYFAAGRSPNHQLRLP